VEQTNSWPGAGAYYPLRACCALGDATFCVTKYINSPQRPMPWLAEGAGADGGRSAAAGRAVPALALDACGRGTARLNGTNGTASAHRGRILFRADRLGVRIYKISSANRRRPGAFKTSFSRRRRALPPARLRWRACYLPYFPSGRKGRVCWRHGWAGEDVLRNAAAGALIGGGPGCGGGCLQNALGGSDCLAPCYRPARVSLNHCLIL